MKYFFIFMAADFLSKLEQFKQFIDADVFQQVTGAFQAGELSEEDQETILAQCAQTKEELQELEIQKEEALEESAPEIGQIAKAEERAVIQTVEDEDKKEEINQADTILHTFPS